MMNRRELLRRTGVAAAALGIARLTGNLALGWSAPADKEKKKLLVFTRSQTFEHSCLKRPNGNESSLLAKIATELVGRDGFVAT